jgi:hypothetical protein
MMPFYERTGRGDDLCKISSANMIEATIQVKGPHTCDIDPTTFLHS